MKYKYRKAKLLLCGIVAISLSTTTLAEESSVPQGLPAEVIKVTPRTIERTLEAVGSLRANEAVVIRPEQTGRVDAIHFKEGQPVKKGDRLFTLEASTYRALLEQAKASEKLSRIELNQAEQLLKKKLGSKHARDSALAQLQINQAKTNLALTQLKKMTIFSPFDGTTGLRDVSIGDYVNNGDELVELVDSQQIKADFRVPEVYLSQLQIDQDVRISIDAFPGEHFLGKIYAVAPQIDTRGRSLALRAIVPNQQGQLKPGLFARIRLLLERKEATLMIPEQAIVPRGKNQLVYKVVDNTISMQPVTLGLRQRGEVEILSGLNAGDIIVTAGQLKLQPGSPITPIFIDPKKPSQEKSEGDS